MPVRKDFAVRLLKWIPDDGNITNQALREKVGWTEGAYGEAKSFLRENGYVSVGRGYGGTLSLTKEGLKKKKELVGKTEGRTHFESLLVSGSKAKSKEAPLYEIFMNAYEEQVLRNPADTNYNYIIKKTASMRRKGQYSNPDVTVITVEKLDLIPEVNISVNTFEIKSFTKALDLDGIYEAAAHSRFGNYNFFVYEWPRPSRVGERMEPVENRDYLVLKELAQKYNVGVLRIAAKTVRGGSIKYDLIIESEPDRSTPDNSDCEAFLKDILSDADIKKLKALISE